MERLDLEISQCKKEIQHINFLLMSSHNRMDLMLHENNKFNLRMRLNNYEYKKNKNYTPSLI